MAKRDRYEEEDESFADEAPAPKRKVGGKAPASRRPEPADEDEDEAPAPARKVRRAPVEDEDEDEAPRRPSLGRAGAATRAGGARRGPGRGRGEEEDADQPPPPRLVEVCEELFAYLAELNQLGRMLRLKESADAQPGAEAGAGEPIPTADEVRGTVTKMLREIENGDPRIVTHEVSIGLYAACDGLIAEAGLPWSASYRKVGYDPEIEIGTLDEDFWKALEHVMQEPDSDATEQRLEVFVTAIGMGYFGRYVDPEDPARVTEEVKSRLAKAWSRIGKRFEPERERANRRELITPQAYKHTLEDDITPEPVGSTLKWAVMVCVAVVGLIVGFFVLSAAAESKLNAEFDTVQKRLSETSKLPSK